MKKLFLLYALFYLFISCGKDDQTHQITDFTKPISITVEPYEDYPYAMMNIWIKGNVNDTILIKLHSKESQPILKLSGDIKERWYTDYYGGGKRTVIFEPYKATEGNLEIQVAL